MQPRAGEPPLAARPRAVVACGLRVRFGPVLALRGLTLEVPWGERLAILGPNGAGKTTLLRVLAGALRPSDGTLRLAGLDPAVEGPSVRARLGVLSHQTYLYGELTAIENLRLYGCLYGVQRLDQRIGALLDQVGLGDRRHDRVDSLSRGLQQRLAIARAVLHEPDILLLDEPETGLDLSAQHLLDDLLLRADAQRAVLMSTHDFNQARRLCRRAIVLVEGRLAADLPASDLDPERLSSLYRAAPPARLSS